MPRSFSLVARTTEHQAAAFERQQNTLNRAKFRDFGPGTIRLAEVVFDVNTAKLALTFTEETRPVEANHHDFATSDFGVFPAGEWSETTPPEPVPEPPLQETP